MPELPEVETVRRGLLEILDLPSEEIVSVKKSSKKLRYNSTLAQLHQVKSQKIRAIHRKAKYLLFELDRHYLLSHLGMTGSWRIEQDKRKHDHIRILLKGGRVLTYHDPRRFGFFEVLTKESLSQLDRFKSLGPDPVVDPSFTGEYLFNKTRSKQTSIKSLIMDQKVVVGVGNIYASEALYLAGIHPEKPAGRLTAFQVERLAEAIVEVLQDAIDCGGTTISDFKQAGGSAGYFQNFLLAYGRDREPCCFCGHRIESRAIVGRNSFWCPHCQKL